MLRVFLSLSLSLYIDSTCFDCSRFNYLDGNVFLRVTMARVNRKLFFGKLSGRNGEVSRGAKDSFWKDSFPPSFFSNLVQVDKRECECRKNG